MNANHKDKNPSHDLYWETLEKSHPDEICRRIPALHDEIRRGYILPILNQSYLILPEERKILRRSGESFAEEHFRDNFFLMVLWYLLNAKGAQPTGKWIGEKELKGGVSFFRGPHALPVEEIRQAFSRDSEGFSRAATRFGGVEILFGDKAFALTVFPGVPLAYVLWEEDQEFPARVTVLFDAKIQNHFSLDGIWCLVSEVSQRFLDARG